MSVVCELDTFKLVAEQLPLLRELNDIKRLYARNLGSHSLATQVFFGATKPLHLREPLNADLWCAAIVCAARLGAITPHILNDIGVAPEERLAVYQNSIKTHTALPQNVKNTLLHAAKSLDSVSIEKAESPSEWVANLAASPRAGATCPGKPRIALEPAEMHSDHCILVATNAYILADIFGAKKEDAWLISLCHHLHNAYLPDAGFTGEVLLDTQLKSIIDSQRSRVLKNLTKDYQERIIELFSEIDDLTSPLAQTFHAADTIDRVIQMEHYERAANFKVINALEDFNLVHEGSAQRFQHELLNSIGITYKAVS
jgi:5'-deoxynucleotidase YfbR-like HD superfamily hydrolase